MCAGPTQGNVLDTLGSDWRYERALQGIRLLAKHHVGQLVQAIIAWRQAVNEDIKKNFSSNNVVNVQGVCKRVRKQLSQRLRQQRRAAPTSQAILLGAPPLATAAAVACKKHPQSACEHCAVQLLLVVAVCHPTCAMLCCAV